MKKILIIGCFLFSLQSFSQSLISQDSAINSFYPGHITAAGLKNFAYSVCTWCAGSIDSLINLKLDSSKRTAGTDSVFGYHNGIKVFQFLDSIPNMALYIPYTDTGSAGHIPTNLDSNVWIATKTNLNSYVLKSNHVV